MVIKMDANELEEIAKKINNEELVLLFILNNEDNYLKILDEYEIYNEKLNKLFALCNDDFELLIYSLKIIKKYYFITKDVVDVNLSLEHPIPFAVQVPEYDPLLNMLNISIDGANFRKKFNEVTKPDALKKIENFFKDKQ